MNALFKDSLLHFRNPRHGWPLSMNRLNFGTDNLDVIYRAIAAKYPNAIVLWTNTRPLISIWSLRKTIKHFRDLWN